MKDAALSPGSIIGIFGGGQLGRMTALAASALGYRTHIFTPYRDDPALQVTNLATVAPYEDKKAVEAFAKQVNVITLEFENVPVASLELAAKFCLVYPHAKVLGICQHRILEKDFVRAAGIETAAYARVTDIASMDAAINAIGLPAILKTTTHGYDGKGQWKIMTKEDAASVIQELGSREAVLEGFVSFEREISVITARNAASEVRCFPPTENTHRNHILHTSVVPATLSEMQTGEAMQIARILAERLNVIGLLTVEMFVCKDGKILVNELAPRPHNSGHWTMDGCATSQFEQLVRAVTGLPLGGAAMLFPCEMRNLIGEEAHEWQRWLETPNAKLHLYGKTEARAGRKMGHVNLLKKPD